MVQEDPRTIQIIRRIARIWGGVILALGALVFLMEIFDTSSVELEPYPWFENLMPLSVGVSIVGLGIAYRREGLGGGITVTFLLINLGLYLLTGREAVLAVILIMTPILIPGVLYLVCWGMEKAGSGSTTNV